MNKTGYILWFSFFLLGCNACSNKEFIQTSTIQSNCGTDGALAECLTPKFSPEYYIEQGVKYFQTMQSDIPIDVIPNYSELVIRWEWPPWLLLTGFKKDFLISSDILLKLNPTKYDIIDCKYFDKQPFCRCHVIFDYSGEKCPIYEEFIFNNQGQITFIEAWSDYESGLPMGSGNDSIWDEEEFWGMKEINRLSTKVPGLGNDSGRININSVWMTDAMKIDKDVAELVKRLKNPVSTYLEQLIYHQEELSHGCEPKDGDVFPYYHP